MSPEQLEGYLRRLELKFDQPEGDGLDGTFLLGFDTESYESALPPGGKLVRLILSIRKQGEILSVQAPFLYDANEAADPKALYECLLDINYAVDGFHFEVDRRDGEVRGACSIPIRDSNLSFDAFRKLLFAIPVAVDHFDARIRKCLRKPATKAKPRTIATEQHAAPLAESVSRLIKVVEVLVGRGKPRRRRQPRSRQQVSKQPDNGRGQQGHEEKIE